MLKCNSENDQIFFFLGQSPLKKIKVKFGHCKSLQFQEQQVSLIN